MGNKRVDLGRIINHNGSNVGFKLSFDDPNQAVIWKSKLEQLFIDENYEVGVERGGYYE